MGFFTSVHYPIEEHHLTEIDVRRLVTYIHVPSLEHHMDREKLVQDAILDRRKGDGKISLEQIYELLTHLKDQNQITKYDRDGSMKVLQEHFAKL